MPIYETLDDKFCPYCEGPVQVRIGWESYPYWGSTVLQRWEEYICSYCGEELSLDELLDLMDLDEEDEDD